MSGSILALEVILAAGLRVEKPAVCPLHYLEDNSENGRRKVGVYREEKPPRSAILGILTNQTKRG